MKVLTLCLAARASALALAVAVALVVSPAELRMPHNEWVLPLPLLFLSVSSRNFRGPSHISYLSLLRALNCREQFLAGRPGCGVLKHVSLGDSEGLGLESRTVVVTVGRQKPMSTSSGGVLQPRHRDPLMQHF